MRFKEITFTILCFIIFSFNPFVNAQNDVMLQAFYWNVPVDKNNNNGSWWDNLSNKADELKNSGFTRIEITIDPANISSKKLFESMGFRNISEKIGDTINVQGNIAIRDYYRPGGHFMLFEKNL